MASRVNRLPYDRTLLEFLACWVMTTVMGHPSATWRDTGRATQVHDFDLLSPDGTVVPVEVTTAMNDSELKRLAAIQQHQAALKALAPDWHLVLALTHGARISKLVAELPGLIADVESAGLASFQTRQPAPAMPAIAERFAGVGVGDAQGWRTTPGAGSVMLRQPSVAHRDSNSVTHAVERVARLRDNETKLARAGGGHLFVWIDASDPAHLAFWDPARTGLASKPQLPQAINVVWAGQLFVQAQPAGTTSAWCGGLWRATNGDAWEDLTTLAPHLGLSLQ